MTVFKRLCVVLFLLCVCSPVVYAADIDEGIGEPEPTATVEPTVTPLPTVEPTATPAPTLEPTPVATARPEPTPIVIIVEAAVPEVTPRPSLPLEPTPRPSPSPEPGLPVVEHPVTIEPDGFAATLMGIFGEYHPRMQSVVTTLDDGTQVESIVPVPGLAGLDWPWISGVVLFSIVLNGFFLALGVLLKRG